MRIDENLETKVALTVKMLPFELLSAHVLVLGMHLAIGQIHLLEQTQLFLVSVHLILSVIIKRQVKSLC
jgi:hypothetical protein